MRQGSGSMRVGGSAALAAAAALLVPAAVVLGTPLTEKKFSGKC